MKFDLTLDQEAREVAASVLREFGRNWLADQVQYGKAPSSRLEIRVAKRALMVARRQEQAYASRCQL